MDEAVKTQEVGRYTVEIHHDDIHRDVRDYDNVGRICGLTGWTFNEDDDSYRGIRQTAGESIVALPLKVLDGPYTIVQETDDWSYADGFYWAPMSAVGKEGFANVDELKKCLRAELSTLNDELSGNVYGFIVNDPDGEHVASCWGFIGDDHYAMSEGVAVAEWHNYNAACIWAELPEWVRQSVLIAADA